MSALNPQTQLSAYGLAVRLGDMVQQSDAFLARVKQLLTNETKDVPVEELARCLGELRSRQAQANSHLSRMLQILGVSASGGPATQSTASLRGSSRSISLPDVISMLSLHRKSGTLRVVAVEARPLDADGKPDAARGEFLRLEDHERQGPALLPRMLVHYRLDANGKRVLQQKVRLVQISLGAELRVEDFDRPRRKPA